MTTPTYTLGQLGPLMVDVTGPSLTDVERERLQHPLVGGVILFTRNYQSPAQLAALCSEIHALRHPKLLIGVDHEGGRVQRFREGFTRIPPMQVLGEFWNRHGSHHANTLARQVGWVMAAELRSCGVDFSFAPVLDLDHGCCAVIGNRAFHANPDVVAHLAHSLQLGMKQAGMAAVGKHFPGHGFVNEDSHHAIPVDPRSLAEIAQHDLIAFKSMVQQGLNAVMPAHVIYPKVDSATAGFSRIWLQDILRGELAFDGAIFSDDLGMAGAGTVGDMLSRVNAALDAGCDMALICNQPEQADHVLKHLHRPASAASLARFARMHGRTNPPDLTSLRAQPKFVAAVHLVGAIGMSEVDLPFPPVGEPYSPGN
ncbi:beta-N-acetylhexosaminidase [Chitinivorax sp. B]|uniref:beta-N-acetylhexosaminidase n=1 Tax=Chitinivorax sp. B TaxID=2502235 RepID=UPI0010F90E80|nr:beta-N-acetylhexosaminidase [Chitinivorax sp. B]